MSVFDLMHSGKIYNPEDEEIMEEQRKCFVKLRNYNSSVAEGKERWKLLYECFASFGKGSWIERPFYANWAGKFCEVGDHVYANFNLTLVDDAPIYIGDNTMIGPNVIITTATHPLSPRLREHGAQYNKSVRIGRNCFIGAGAIICPGVTIGDDAVIGAGSVVTRDIPPKVVAVGTPCKVIREITSDDDIHYDGGKKIEVETWW